MAMIKCAECGKDVSDKAAACPNCGNPIGQQIVEEQVTTVQFTNKRWKKLQLISLGFLVSGLFFIFDGGGYTVLGVFLWLAAVGTGVYSRVGAWWTNG